jgi:hypothetical protein
LASKCYVLVVNLLVVEVELVLLVLLVLLVEVEVVVVVAVVVVEVVAELKQQNWFFSEVYHKSSKVVKSKK